MRVFYVIAAFLNGCLPFIQYAMTAVGLLHTTIMGARSVINRLTGGGCEAGSSKREMRKKAEQQEREEEEGRAVRERRE